MLAKVVTVIFYAALALFFFGAGIPFLEVVIGVCALILGILAAITP
jgi:hypothetical protein